jgi:NAD(P)-dependent dehydrogenase (short-subunit alcohol dehydrogenase family)
MTVALVTGANSGIGRGVAVELARRGWDVVGSMRDLAKGDKLRAMAAAAGVEVGEVVMDVTDTDSVRRAVGEVLERTGRIDVLVNNAGVGGNAVTEECPVELYASVMDVNLYGTVRCIQAVLPHMRARGSGCIVNISSIAGRIAAIGQSPYVASKWAVEGVSEGLAQELAPHGIRVAIIEPGVVRSAIFAKNTDAPSSTGAYGAAYRRMFRFYAAGLSRPGEPAEVAEVIYEAATTDQPRLRYTCGWGGAQLAGSRASVSDEDWVALGAIADDDEYDARFEQLFGLDIRPPI